MVGPTSVETSSRRMLATLTVFACLFLMTASSQTWAGNRSRVLLVIAGGISIRDITDPRLVNISQLFQDGAAGLLNVRTGKPTENIEAAVRPGMLAGCLTLGAGAMASGGMEVSRAYDATTVIGGAKAGDIYTARTGCKWSDENGRVLSRKTGGAWLGASPRRDQNRRDRGFRHAR